jgi:hypothetical protein
MEVSQTCFCTVFASSETETIETDVDGGNR